MLQISIKVYSFTQHKYKYAKFIQKMNQLNKLSLEQEFKLTIYRQKNLQQ